MAETYIFSDFADIADVTSMLHYESTFTREQIDYITGRVARAAREVFGDRLMDVRLFGSYARGDFRDWSDVDILIVADVDGERMAACRRAVAERLGNVSHYANLLVSLMYVTMDHYRMYGDVEPFLLNAYREGIRIDG